MRNPRALFLCLLLAVILPMSCTKKTSGQERIQHNEEVPVERTSFSFSQENAPYDLLSAYKVQPGDVLDVLYQIQTWKKKDFFTVQVDHAIAVHFVDTPELNQNQPVLPNGYISLPYLGQYYVVDKTPQDIQKELEELYKNILRDPDIYVTVPEFRTAIREFKADLHTAPRGLSRLVTVRPDGYVTFPMVGEYLVANRTIIDVNQELNKDYDEMISGLHVDLFLEKHSGSQIYILGDVFKPGAYQIKKPITVAQAVAVAGSFRPSANISQIVVVRKHQDQMMARIIDLESSAVLGGRNGLFYLQPDDIIYIPKRRIAKWAEVAQEISQVLLFRGWGFSLSHDPFEDEDE